MAEPSGLTRRPATEEDTEFARLAHHLAYRDVVERQFGSWDDAAQDAFFYRDWSAGGFEILELNGEPCGYVAVDDRSDDVVVREVVILPSHQSRGLGSQVLRETIEHAHGRGVPVRLGALRANRAVGLYRRMGFQETEGSATHIGMELRPQIEAM